MISPRKPKFNFDIKQFLVRKGERVAFGVALAIMLCMVVISGLSLARGKSSASNARFLNDLNSEAKTKITTSKPTAEVAALPPDLLAALAANGADLIDPDLFACDQPFFSRESQADRKWRRPKVLAPVEFTAEVVRGGIESYMFVMGEDQRPKEIAVLMQRDTRQDLNAAVRMQGIFAKYNALYAVGPGSLSRGGPGGPGPGGSPGGMEPAGAPGSTAPGGGRPGGGGGAPHSRLTRGRGGMGSGGGSESSGAESSGAAAGNSGDGSGSGAAPGRTGARPGGRSADLFRRAAFSREGDLKFISVDEFVQKPSGRRLARTVIPTRMGIISGSFPYRAQLDEYRKALHFDSIESMLNDPGASLEFLGMQVQRRTVTPRGESITDWEDLDIETPIKQLKLASTGSQRENESFLRYGIIVYPNRLVMPRPRLIRYESYPEERLRLVAKAIADLSKPNVVVLAPPPKPSIFDKEIDVWSDAPVIGDEAATAPAASTSSPRPALPGSNGAGGASGGRRRGARGRFSESGLAGDEGSMAPRGQPATRVPPEYCLFRFLDVTIEPGRTYEYRVKVEIANPSYNQPERALTESVTQEPVLIADDWAVVSRTPAEATSKGPGGEAMWNSRPGPAGMWKGRPTAEAIWNARLAGDGMRKRRPARDGDPLLVTVPDDLEFYAVDEPAGATSQTQNRKTMEVHRWLDFVQVNPTDRASVMPVGAWSILPRIPVSRGEYIGRTVEMPVPVWKPTQNAFVFATPPEDEERQGTVKKTIRHAGVRVDFGTDPLSESGAAPILVDFEGGKRTQPADPKTVLADTPWEVLVYTADNKLILKNTAADTTDPTRTARVTDWEKWLADTANLMNAVKNGSRQPGGGRGRRPGGR